MKLRPEFELLDQYRKRLSGNLTISLEFLHKVKDHINVCEHIAEVDYESRIIERTQYWLDKRAPTIGMDTSPRDLPVSSSIKPGKKFELTANDKRFLHSLRIGVGDSENDEAVE